MRIKRDYSQPFFRQPKRHRGRKALIAALLGILLGFGLFSQWSSITRIAGEIGRIPATATPLPSARASRAAVLAQAGDFAGAAELLASASTERPDNIAYLYEYGKALVELGRHEAALNAAQRIVDLNAGDVHGFALRAAALVASDQASEAIPVALTALELNPGLSGIYATLTRAYIDARRWQDAIAIGERGLDINPSDAELVRAYAYAMQAVGAFDEAADYLESAIELRPNYLPAQFELAALHLARDQDQRAIELYERILALDSRNARALLRLCLAYRKIGQFSRALGFCEDAAANDPEDAETQFQLAMLYYRDRRFAESRAAFQQCVSLDAGFYDLSCRYRLGLSHYYTGDCATGWRLLRESLATAQASDSQAIGNIELGLKEISGDPACIDAAAASVSVQD